MIDVGEKVDRFELVDQEGDTVTLDELLATGPVVVYFYPKAMTPGCTKESCHFRDLQSEFAGLGARIVGVSADQVDRQKEFHEGQSLGFPLLSDPDRTVARLFEVKRVGPLPNKRATFVVDTDRTVLAAIASETSMHAHADEALEVLRKRS